MVDKMERKSMLQDGVRRRTRLWKGVMRDVRIWWTKEGGGRGVEKAFCRRREDCGRDWGEAYCMTCKVGARDWIVYTILYYMYYK